MQLAIVSTRLRSFTLAFLATALSAFAAEKPMVPEGFTHMRTVGGIEEFRLDANGLRVLLYPNRGLPVATVMVTYEIGSRNESTGTTGATHILEHMMFKGTERYNAALGNDYTTQMERIGARKNATTYFDRTNYFAVLPKQYVPLAIKLEADRMRHLRLREDDLRSELTVVRNEYERGENNPVRTLLKEIFATAFLAHPYGHPVIGWKSDIENTTVETLRNFYDRYYWPENAVLSVIGGFDRAATFRAIRQHYGSIGNAPSAATAPATKEPRQLGPRRLTIERAGQLGVVLIGNKIPGGTHQDWAELTLLRHILGADKSGRLYRALDDRGKAGTSFAFAPRLRDPSLFFVGAYLTPESTHEEVERLLLEELEAIASAGISDEELAEAKSVIEAGMKYGRDGPYSIADQINDAIAIGDWTSYVRQPEAIQSVTVEDVQRVAEKYFIERTRTTGWFVPEQSNSVATRGGRPFGPLYFRDPAHFGPEAKANAAPSRAGASGADVDFSKGLESFEIGPIRVVTIDMPIPEVVSFVGSFAAGEHYSPEDRPTLASMTASMLDKGTVSADRFEIARTLDRIGAEIDFTTDTHSLRFSGKFLRDDAGTVLRLLAEQLRQPAFDAAVFETVRTRRISGLLQGVDDPDYRASNRLNRLLYPAAHPNHTATVDAAIESVRQTELAAVRDFHARHYGPESMLLVFAGDIDFEQVRAAVADAFDGWTGGVPYAENTVAPRPPENQRETIRLEDKPSASVRYGQATGLRRTDPDYLPFMVGNYILGGSFNSRLMADVRKEKGLTYDIRARHTGDILTEGHWVLSASFAPDKLEAGLTATEAVVETWHREGVSPDAVAAAIETLEGSYLVNLSTTGMVARQVHSFVQRGFEPTYVDRYPEQLRQVDADKVNRAIRRYLDPAQMALVVAGTVRPPSATTSSGGDTVRRTITVRLDAPDPAWTVSIESVHETEAGLFVVSRLERQSDAAAQVISTITDSVRLKSSPEKPVFHYVLGKTWDWGGPEDYQFNVSEERLETILSGSELIYENRDEP